MLIIQRKRYSLFASDSLREVILFPEILHGVMLKIKAR